MAIRKKRAAVFATATVLAISFLVAAVVFFSLVPKNRTIVPEDGSAVTRVARSYRDDGWYYATSEGEIVKCDAEGNALYACGLNGTAVRAMSVDPKLDGILCFDENYDVYFLSDDGSSLSKTFVRKMSGGWQAVTYDDDYAYFAVASGRNTTFFKYAKNALSGSPVAKGDMYTCRKTGSNYLFIPVVSGTIVGMYTDEDHLFVVTGEGEYHRIDKDFSLNGFEYLTEEELEEIGAEMDPTGTVTLPAGSYDKEKYRTTIKQLAANSALYDRERGIVYVAGTDAELVALDKDFKEVEGKKISLPNTPAKGAAFYSVEEDRLFIGYENISSVTVVNAEEFSVDYVAEVAFYISNLCVPASGDRLVTVCAGNDKSNPDRKELLFADVRALGRVKVTRGLGIGFAVLAALSAVTAVFAGFVTFRKGYDARFFRTLRGIVRDRWLYVIIFCSLAMLVVFCYYPGISSMVLSFFDYTRDNPTMHFNNFANYIKIFSDSANLIAFRNMVIFLLSDIVVALVPPCIFALCLTFMRSAKYSTFARVVLFLPSVLPGIANLLIWQKGIYGVDGVLNTVLKLFSGEEFRPVQFLQDHGIVSLIMMGFPFVGSYLIFFGALVNVPSSYYEAAELDGCKLWKRIFTIDLPMISPQIKYVFILSFIQSVQNFGRVLMTTDGQFGTQIPIVLMYKQLQNGDYGLSSAYATLMFLVLIAVTVLNMKIQTEDSGI